MIDYPRPQDGQWIGRECGWSAIQPVSQSVGQPASQVSQGPRVNQSLGQLCPRFLPSHLLPPLSLPLSLSFTARLPD